MPPKPGTGIIIACDTQSADTKVPSSINVGLYMLSLTLLTTKQDGDDDKDWSSWEGFSDNNSDSDSESESESSSGSEWGGFDDLLERPESSLNGDETPTTANSLSDHNESNSDDESVWEGFDDLPERLEPDHVLILNKTLEDASRSALQRFNGGIRYDVFINNRGGKDAVRDLILSSIDRDLLDLIENGDFSLKSLKKLERKKSTIKQNSGIYVHVVYDPDKSDVVGIYVGSAERLAFRVEYHIGEHEALKTPQKGSARKRKKKPRRQSAHQKFWAREGYKDFWLCFVELDFPKSAKEKDEMDVLLNILEKYAAVLFRSLPRPLLQRILPHGVDINPYRRIGLNVDDPLSQFRPSLRGSSATFSAKTGSRGRKKAKHFYYSSRPHPLLNIVFRFADPSKGDKSQVQLRCCECWGSTYIVDRTPRYEISTGVYLPHLSMPCVDCSPKHYKTFIPADTSIPFKLFKTVVYHYQHMANRNAAKDLEFASRTELEATKPDLLVAWIRFQGFEYRERSSKASLWARADDIRKWLEDPKLFNKPPRLHHAPDETRHKKKKPLSSRKQTRRGYIELEAVHLPEDLSRLSSKSLAAFIRSRGYPIERKCMLRINLLSRAREIWDLPIIIFRNRNMGPEEVRSRADLDGLSSDNLRIWITSRGETRNLTRLYLKELLNLARRIWDNLELINKMVGSRADLDGMSTDGLRRWIQSQGWEQSISGSAKQAALLDLARWLWDNPDIAHSGPIKLDEVQSRGDLGRLSKSGLYTWVISHNYQATAWGSLSREEAIEKARAVWDDLKSLPNDCRATPKDPPAKNHKRNYTIKDIKHPETHLHLLSMKHKELFAWLKFHDIRTGKGKRHERLNKEELLALAERTFNAIQNDDLNNFRKTLQSDKIPLKVPQTREDLGQIRLRDLVQWIRSQGVACAGRNMKKDRALALAQKTWDGAENGTIDKMQKGRQSSRSSVKIPQTLEDFGK
jgi:hypothetical protein